MGYGFSAIALPQLKAVVTNAFGRNEFARTYYQPFTIDDESGSWIGKCILFFNVIWYFLITYFKIEIFNVIMNH